MSIELTSTAFKAGTSIPEQYTGDGADRSPPLHWSEPPSGTKSIALICDDPDAPRGTWVHWVLFNLPPSARELEEGVPTTTTLGNGALQGKNDFGNVGYGGPAPPKGKSHRYFFKLYALDILLDLSSDATKAQLEDDDTRRESCFDDHEKNHWDRAHGRHGGMCQDSPRNRRGDR